MKDIRENLRSQLDFFYQWEKERPEKVFLRQPFGDEWKTMTYREAGQQARKIATALQELGLKKGDHIGIFSKNCYHWVLADLAIMMGGFVSTPFYPNLSTEQTKVVLEKSDAKLVFAGKLDQWDNINAAIPADMPIIKFPHYQGNAKVDRGHEWADLIAQHELMLGNPLPNITDTWTILFTSGTTGTPKGVVHTYENAALIINAELIKDNLKVGQVEENVFFSFLPLNHIAERTAVEIGAFMSGGSISFAESLDTFAKNLQETQPTLFFAVPRIWTKFYMAVIAKLPQKRLDTLLKIPIVSGLIKKRIKTSLGLSNANMIMTGASITPEPLKQWYRSLDINLREVYGMTENFGGFSLMPEHDHKAHTVGRPLPFCEGKTDPDTGEILMNVPWVMKGYYKDPELTAAVIKDGWLHTGDRGEFDKDGYLKIIGRVKDAFKTTKGKFVVPTLIEGRFAESEMIEQICVAGLGIPQPIALVNLSEAAASLPEQEVRAVLSQQLQHVNQQSSKHELVSTVVVTKDAWSPDNQLLTPTLKIRRASIDDQYMEQYKNWHESDMKIIWEA
ncbi:MAG: AMP-binding protein [Bacteroidota bacterium]